MSKAEVSWKRVSLTTVIALALFVLTAALYWPTTGYELLIFDDDRYVTDNQWVKHGLSPDSLRWAFTTLDAEFWHPLTWVSYLLDYSAYGLFPGGYHLTNLLLHAVSTALLFYCLWRMTKSLWPSALVAALFGWHPLHVESVAWIAERKDLLSALFMWLTLLAYVRYVEKTTVARYLLALLLFALGLMSKPMLVTLPCVLLLLDYWPLGRISLSGLKLSGWRRPLLEKLPFFALALAACVLTIIAQHSGGSLKSVGQVPLSLRALNALVAYVTYLLNTFLPAGLCVHYPLPRTLPIFPAIFSALVLAAISLLVFQRRQKYPWTMVGWLWFLGTLVPVIGLLQVGSHAMADRYTYIPLVGVFIAVAWSLAAWLQSRPAWRGTIIGGVVVLLLGCVVASRAQMNHWRDSVTLFAREVSLHNDVALAQGNLGVALSNAGRSADAIHHFRAGLCLDPDDKGLHYNLGSELVMVGKTAEAERHFREALSKGRPNAAPPDEQIHNNLGGVLLEQGKLAEAAGHFKQAIALNPAYAKPYLNYGVVAQKQGQTGLAYTNYSEALRLDPDWPEVLDKMAALLAGSVEPEWRDLSRAARLSHRANDLTQHQIPAYLETLADICAAQGNYSDAIATAESARSKALARGLTNLTAELDKKLTAYKAGRGSAR